MFMGSWGQELGHRGQWLSSAPGCRGPQLQRPKGWGQRVRVPDHLFPHVCGLWAGRPQACRWHRQHSSLAVTGLLAAWLRIPRTSVPSRQGGSGMAFPCPLSEVMSHHFRHILWVHRSQEPIQVQGVGTQTLRLSRRCVKSFVVMF